MPIFFLLLVLVVFSYTTFVQALVKKNVIVEAGAPLPAASTFLAFGGYPCEYVGSGSGVKTQTPGTYDLSISINRRTFPVQLTVIDSKAPTAKPIDQEIWLGGTLKAESFLTGITDASAVTVSFKTEPDFNRPGQQPVTVVLTDASGNRSEVSATLIIYSDTEKPVITGAKDQTVYVNETISYKTGVTVTDNHDPDVKLQIDNRAVNLAAAGQYPVIYSATDSSGNRAEVPVTITVKARPAGYVSEAQLNALIDTIFVQILKPGMSDLERMSAIFYWIADHINYIGTSDKSDWVKAAYLGITRGTGDCYNYYAAARAMLTHAGYECISLERVPDAKTRHYWNLVKYNGEYYHFDPLPQLKYYHYVCLLRTDAEVAEYSANVQPKFYEFIRNGIPASATVPLDIERKLIYG